MLDPLEIAQIRTQVEESLNETCSIKQRTKSNAGTGPATVEFDRATEVPCRRASEYKADEANVIGQSRSQEWITLTVPIDQSIEATDRVVMDSDGRNFEVVRVLTTEHQAFCKRVLCKAV